MFENEKKENPVSYYAKAFIIATVTVLVFGLFMSRGDDTAYWEWVRSYAYIPFFVLLFLLMYNFFTRKLRADVKEQKRQRKFVMHMSEAVKHTLGEDAEVFRVLRENDDFQEVLYQGYMVLKHGNNETNNTKRMLNRFSEGSVEHSATKIIVQQIECIREQS